MPIHQGSIDASGHHFALTHRSSTGIDIVRVVTDFGSGSVMAPLVFVAVLAMSASPFRHRFLSAALALGVLASGSLMRLGLSVLIGRQRPPASDWAAPAAGYAFPSGHTTGSALAAGVLAYTATRCLPQRRAVRVTAWLVALIFTLAVGFTRIYLGVHWPTDVLGGWTFATVWLSGWLLLLRRYAGRLAQRDGPARR